MMMNPEGASKPAEATDPLVLNGVVLDGEVRGLARCMVEEFAQIGYGPDDLFGLFRRTDYRLMHMILLSEGEAFVRRLIDEVLAGCPVVTVTTTVPAIDEGRCSHHSDDPGDS